MNAPKSRRTPDRALRRLTQGLLELTIGIVLVVSAALSVIPLRMWLPDPPVPTQVFVYILIGYFGAAGGVEIIRGARIINSHSKDHP